MRIQSLIMGLLACIFGSSTSYSEVGYFDCDTPGSHSAEWAREVSRPNIEVDGTIRLIEERPFRNAIPAANVFFSKTPGNALIALRFIAYPEKKDTIFITLWRDEQPQETLTLMEIKKTKEPIPFSMSLQAGELHVTVAGKAFSMPIMNSTVQKISLSCFSAQFKFGSVSMTESN